jgi:uncharacterized membrane protein
MPDPIQLWCIPHQKIPIAGDRRRLSRAVLASRFARGEIDETEYHQRLDVLQRTAY